MDKLKNKKLWIYLGVGAAGIILCTVIIILLSQQSSRDTDPVVADRTDAELQPNNVVENLDDDQAATGNDEEQEDAEDDGQSVRLKTTAYGFSEKPSSAWDFGSMMPSMLSADQTYESIEDSGGLFVKIRTEDQDWWVNRWYIDNGQDTAVEPVEPYEMVVLQPSTFHAYPDAEAPAGHELEPGRVVQVHKIYKDWVAADIKLYAEPMTGDKWFRKDGLIPYDENFANEGYLTIDWDGSYIFDAESGLVKELVDTTQPIIVTGEQDGMFVAHAGGGISGLVRKEDFVPNPFVDEQVTYMGLSAEAKIAWDTFQGSRDDEDLRGIRPIDLYKMYHHAIMMDDAGLLYDLYAHGAGEDIPDRQTFLQEWLQQDEQTKQRAREQAQGLQHIQVEEVTTDDADTAVVRPVSADQEAWFFRLQRTPQGIWKVSWQPRQ